MSYYCYGCKVYDCFCDKRPFKCDYMSIYLPCGIIGCQRDECLRKWEERAKAMAAHPSSQGPAKPADHDEWQCMHYDSGCRCKCTWCQARNGKPVTVPVEPIEVLCGPDGQWSITGLSEEDLWTLYGALGFVIRESMRGYDSSNDKRLEKIIGSVLPD